MKYKEIATSKLVEHPENAKLFRDIKDTDPAFWREFVDSIKTFGIIEPLIVNQATMQVRSGNQRLKAARETGLETVPILLVDPETETDEEIRKMIASNVFRRTINPFAMFEYIGRLRRVSQERSVKSVSQETHKHTQFVSAADIYNSWTPEQKAAIDEWYEQKTEGKKAGKEGELIAMIRAAEDKYQEAEEELQTYRTQIQEIEEVLDAAKAERTDAEREAEKLQEQVDELGKELDDIRNTDQQEEIKNAEFTDDFRGSGGLRAYR